MSKIDEFYSSGGRSKADNFYSSDSRQERTEMNDRRRRDALMGKIHRQAVRNKDLATIADLERMGFTNYGIENRDDKIARYREESHQRRFGGDTVVGGAAGSASTPERGPERDSNGLPSASQQSFSEREEMMREKVFGGGKKGLPWVSLGQQRKDYVDTIRGVLEERDGGMTPALRSSAVKKGKQLGLNDDQINAALSGFAGDELSPSSIAGRKVKKEAKAEEGFDDLIGRNVTDPDTKKFLESLPLEAREEAMRDLAERRKRSADEAPEPIDSMSLGRDGSGSNLPSRFRKQADESLKKQEELTKASNERASDLDKEHSAIAHKKELRMGRIKSKRQESTDEIEKQKQRDEAITESLNSTFMTDLAQMVRGETGGTMSKNDEMILYGERDGNGGFVPGTAQRDRWEELDKKPEFEEDRYNRLLSYMKERGEEDSLLGKIQYPFAHQAQRRKWRAEEVKAEVAKDEEHFAANFKRGSGRIDFWKNPGFEPMGGPFFNPHLRENPSATKEKERIKEEKAFRKRQIEIDSSISSVEKTFDTIDKLDKINLI
jgi:hypothetical protein